MLNKKLLSQFAFVILSIIITALLVGFLSDKPADAALMSVAVFMPPAILLLISTAITETG